MESYLLFLDKVTQHHGEAINSLTYKADEIPIKFPSYFCIYLHTDSNIYVESQRILSSHNNFLKRKIKWKDSEYPLSNTVMKLQ